MMFAKGYDPFRRGGDYGPENRGPILPPVPTDGYPGAEMIAMLGRDNARMRLAGMKLAAAALHVIGEHDGTHRLSLAVAEWAQAIASEGDRDVLHGSPAESRSQAASPAGERSDG